MEFPQWLGKNLNRADVEDIQKEIVRVESLTSAELVPMIVSHSIATGHVPVLLFMLQAIVFWSIAFGISPYVHEVPAWVLELIAIGFALVSTWFQKDSWFWARVLTTRADRHESVLRRAQLEFYLSNIKATEHSTGVLIMVSLLEHEAVVLADQGVAKLVTHETWKHVIEGLIQKIKAGDFRGGFKGAITEVGELLDEKFPVKPGDKNELANELVIKD